MPSSALMPLPRVLCVLAALLLPAGSAWAQQPEAPVPTPVPMLDYALLQRSEQLRREIIGLEAERRQYSIASPVLMMSAGGAVAVAALYTYGLRNPHFDLCGSSSCEGLRIASLVVGTAGLVVAVLGFGKFQSLRGPRNELREKIKAKRAERQAIDARVRVAPLIGPMSLRGLTVAVSF